MVESETRTHLVIHTALVRRYGAAHYPIDLALLFSRLPEAGWLVSEGIASLQDGRSDQVPSKGNVRLMIDIGNKTLGVSGY